MKSFINKGILPLCIHHTHIFVISTHHTPTGTQTSLLYLLKMLIYHFKDLCIRFQHRPLKKIHLTFRDDYCSLICCCQCVNFKNKGWMWKYQNKMTHPSQLTELITRLTRISNRRTRVRICKPMTKYQLSYSRRQLALNSQRYILNRQRMR